MKAIAAFVSLLYPRLCAACDRACDEERAFCVSCAISVERAPPHDRLRSIYLFGGAVASAIRRCKYGDRPEVARALGRLIPPDAIDEDAIVVPIPLHPKRLRARGFNQSALLALATGRPVDVRALERIRDTPPQAGLKAEARRQNVAGAFRARSERVRGRRVALVDDVITTGATVEAASLELSRAGAVAVDVLTLARAVP